MKHYTAKQVALEVLKKADECLKKSEMLKKEHVEKDATPPNGVRAQIAPEKNPKEKKEEKGTDPTGMADYDDKRLKKSEGFSGLAKFLEDKKSKRMSKGETGHEKGINTSTDPSQKSKVMMGTSKAGSSLPGASNSPAKKIADENEAKGKHKQVLGEMKQMPKPKLPV